MGFTIALLSIIGSETIASLAGLGHRIVHLAEGMEMARMFAYIAFVVAIAWHPQHRRVRAGGTGEAAAMSNPVIRLIWRGAPASPASWW